MSYLYHGYLQLPSPMSPDLRRMALFSTIYPGASPVDRTGTIVFPTGMKSIFPMPKMRPFRKSYEELCEQRALELLKRAEDLDVPIYVAWSGGIDSTCVLACLLKHCKEKDRITVLMSEESVTEYPLFFMRYVRHRLRRQEARTCFDLLATKSLLVTGEHNDQLFGSDLTEDAISIFGIDVLLGRLQWELITSLYEIKLDGDRETALFFSELFSRFLETAPIALKTNFDMLWWINFALKWQCVNMRKLIFSTTPIARDHLQIFYQPFFGTEEFQLWSMNNQDQRIRRDWRSYKWPAKDVIYGFTKDADYRDRKTKEKSLGVIMRDRPYHVFLDENYTFHQKLDWYQPVNDLQPNVREMRGAA